MGRREAALRASVIRKLEPLNAVAVENPALPGTPDVNYVGGWLELKSLERWPAHAKTKVRCEHWTPVQRVFHLRRCNVGGGCRVLLEICLSHDYLLLDGLDAVRLLGEGTQAELRAAAIFVWHGKAEALTGLLEFLTSHPECSPTFKPPSPF